MRFCRSVLEHGADLLNDRAVRSGTSCTGTTSSRNSSGSVRRDFGEGLPWDQSFRLGAHRGRKRGNPIQDIERSPPRCINNVRTRPVIQQVSNKSRILGSNGDVERSHSFVGLCEIGVALRIGDASGILIGAVHLGVNVGSMLLMTSRNSVLTVPPPPPPPGPPPRPVLTTPLVRPAAYSHGEIPMP